VLTSKRCVACWHDDDDDDDDDDNVFYLFLQKEPNAIYPLGTFHRGLKKAHVMMLPSCPLWYYEDPFSLWLTWWCAKHFTNQPPSVPFIQMTDTDVTFLLNYNCIDLARLYVMILTSPPSLPRSRLWAGFISHSFLTTTNWTLPAHTPRSLPPLLPCLVSHFRQDRVASVPPAPHPPIKGLPIPKSFPPIPSSRGVVRVVSLHYV
jgi:hypothetical protein